MDKDYDIEKDPYFKYVTKFEDLTKPSARAKEFFRKVGAKFNPSRNTKPQRENNELKFYFLSNLDALRSRMYPEEEKNKTLFDVFEDDESYTIVAQTVFEPFEESIVYNHSSNELVINNPQKCIFLDLTGKADSSKISVPAEFAESCFLNGIYTAKLKKKVL